MRKLLVPLAALALSLSLAQQGPGGPGGPGGPNPQVRAMLEKYRPVFDLTGTVALMADVDKQPGLAYTKAQAQKLLPVLRNLQTRPDLKPADAEKILANLEDNLLTDKQLTWMDKTRLERQEARRRQMQAQGGQQQGQGLRIPGGPPIGGGAGGGQGGPGGRGGFFQAIQQGKPFNPFSEGRAKESLAAVVALLQKK